MPGLGPLVKVINRVRGADGSLIPYEGVVDGEAIVVRDTLDLPLGVARILIHGSMYRVDPVTLETAYKLGCAELGAPEDPIPVEETQRVELIDRSGLPEQKMELQRIRNNNRVRRHDPIGVSTPAPNADGALQGSFERL